MTRVGLPPSVVLAIDPGPERSAWLELVDGRPDGFAIVPNDLVLGVLRYSNQGGRRPDVTVIEQIESFGMAVGREVFETVHWSGRFTEAVERSGGTVVRLSRRAVKLHLCGSQRAKDTNIRQALLDRFGGASARGTKKQPGPLYGIANDVWSALAIAVTYADTSL